MINHELKQPYLETLKHIQNFCEVTSPPSETSLGMKYYPIHIENAYSGNVRNLYNQAFGLAVKRGVLTFKDGFTTKKFANEGVAREHKYIDVDAAKLLDELELYGSSETSPSQLIQVELKLNGSDLYIKAKNGNKPIKNNFSKHRNPFKLIRFLTNTFYDLYEYLVFGLRDHLLVKPSRVFLELCHPNNPCIVWIEKKMLIVVLVDNATLGIPKPLLSNIFKCLIYGIAIMNNHLHAALDYIEVRQVWHMQTLLSAFFIPWLNIPGYSPAATRNLVVLFAFDILS